MRYTKAPLEKEINREIRTALREDRRLKKKKTQIHTQSYSDINYRNPEMNKQ